MTCFGLTLGVVHSSLPSGSPTMARGVMPAPSSYRHSHRLGCPFMAHWFTVLVTTNVSRTAHIVISSRIYITLCGRLHHSHHNSTGIFISCAHFPLFAQTATSSSYHAATARASSAVAAARSACRRPGYFGQQRRMEDTTDRWMMIAASVRFLSGNPSFHICIELGFCIPMHVFLIIICIPAYLVGQLRP